MEYQTLYRRWRPKGFTDFVGQQHVVTTLTNAITSDRIAHAYLFTGPRGTGKTSTAKILAKALNCIESQGAEPCDHCLNCKRINEGVFMDVLEIDGASNRGIDEIRELREKIKFAPAEGKYKIYIIDEVHMLTAEAFNALLKTLEEPPRFVVFILATTEVHKLPLTILSRCQRFDFKRFTTAEITGRLAHILTTEGITAEPAALELIADYAEGGMRDALSLLEQALAHSSVDLTETDVRVILGLVNQEMLVQMAQALQEKNIANALSLLEAIVQDGKDLFQFGRSLVAYFRNLLLNMLSGVNPEVQFSIDELIRYIEILSNATIEVKKSLQSSLPLELALIKLATQTSGSPSSVESRLTKLETMVQNGSFERVAVPVPTGDQGSPGLTPAKSGAEVTTPAKAVGEVASEPKKAVAAVALNAGRFEQWDEFLEVVKTKKRTLAALIQEGKPMGVKEGQLYVGFPPNLKFHLENLGLAQNKELLETILCQVVGQDLKINCIPETAEIEPKVTPSIKATPDLLNKAVSLFGGEVLPIKKEEK